LIRVDDAIVMIENIVRYIEEAIPRSMQRSRGRSDRLHDHIDHAVLCAVFIPLLFMWESLAGYSANSRRRHLSRIGVGIYLTDADTMMCSLFLKHENKENRGAFTRRLKFLRVAGQRV